MSSVRRHLRDALLAVVPLLVTQDLCWADDSGGFYVGLGAGAAQISDDDFFIDDSSMAYKAFAGYSFNEHFSLEGTLISLDDVETYIPFAADTLFPLLSDSEQVVADGQGFNVSAALKMPLGESFDLNAKIGILMWDTDSIADGIDSSGDDLSFGIGLQYSLNEALSIRVDFEALDFGDVDANVGTAALEYRF